MLIFPFFDLMDLNFPSEFQLFLEVFKFKFIALDQLDPLNLQGAVQVFQGLILTLYIILDLTLMLMIISLIIIF